MTRMNKTQARVLRIFLDHAKGACLSSQWTTGAGRHTKQAAIPRYCEKLHTTDPRVANAPGTVGKRARQLLREHPRAQYLIICTNYRAARAALKKHAERG